MCALNFLNFSPLLLEVYLAYEPVCPPVGRSVFWSVSVIISSKGAGGFTAGALVFCILFQTTKGVLLNY